MPETPDFEKLAQRLLLGYGLSTLETEVAELRRLVWNARCRRHRDDGKHTVPADGRDGGRSLPEDS
jgi:hypothetical protein